MKQAIAIVVMLAAAWSVGCITIKHEVAPIHATIDVNIRVDRQLDQFFDFQNQPVDAPAKSGADAPAPTTPPSN